MKRVIIFLLLMSSFQLVKAQNQQWFQYYGSYKLTERWSLLPDGGYRWSDAFKHSSQYLFRTGLGYNISKNVRLTAGFAHLGFFTDQTLSKLEYRPYQELTIKHQLDRMNVSVGHRLRVEQRFFYRKSTEDTSGESTFNHRFRYALNFGIPVFKSVSLTLGDEILINAKDGSPGNLLDQNRLVIGPKYQYSEYTSFGLIYDYLTSGSPSNLTHTHILWLQLRHKFDFSS